MNYFNKASFDESELPLPETYCPLASNYRLVETIGQQIETYLSPNTVETAANGSVAVSLILSVAFLIRSLALLLEKAND